MTVKIGVIGVGNMGKNHVRLTREMNNEFEFVGVYDPNAERVAELGLTDVCFPTEDALIEACDALVVVVPSSLHKQMALKIAAAGKHLLVEKPLALSEADAREIVAAYEGTGKVLTVGHVERYNPVVLELEKIVKEEDVVAVHIERCSSRDTRIQDTDVVYDLMIHDIDILVNGLNPGTKVEKISSFGRCVYSEKYMDYVESIMQFDNGVVASVVSSRATENKIRTIQVHCVNAYLEADLLHRTLTISRKTTYNLDIGYNPTYRQENIVEQVFVGNEEPLKAELKHFHECITQGKQTRTNGELAADSIHVLDMIKKELY